MVKKTPNRQRNENVVTEQSRVIARNRRATYDYDISHRFEAGLVLTGTEIKALRDGKGSIAEAYVRPRDGELWLVGATIARYDAGTTKGHDPTRDRKLLLHKREIDSLVDNFEQRSLTIIPMQLYIIRGLAKLQIGLGRGRRQHDKRQKIAHRDAAKQIREALRS